MKPPKIIQLFLFLSFSSLIFSGCAQRRVYYPYPPAPTRYERNQVPSQEPRREEGIEQRQIHPSMRREEQQYQNLPSRKGPAHTLYRDAERAMKARNYNQAEMLLNRALRIEPRNGWYWHAMGLSKYARGSYEQSVQFCLKSNNLAGGDLELKRANQNLLHKAYGKIHTHER